MYPTFLNPAPLPVREVNGLVGRLEAAKPNPRFVAALPTAALPLTGSQAPRKRKPGGGRPLKPCSVGGVTYPSRKAAMDALGAHVVAKALKPAKARPRAPLPPGAVTDAALIEWFPEVLPATLHRPETWQRLAVAASLRFGVLVTPARIAEAVALAAAAYALR